MQIDRVTHDSIASMFRAFDAQLNDEIEAMFTGGMDVLDRSSMQRLLEYLRSTTVHGVTSVTSLDVSVELGGRLDRVRVTVTGEDAIKDALSDRTYRASASVMVKRRLRPSVEVHEHRFRVNMKREEPVSDADEIERVMDSVSADVRHTYRLKRRFSFPTPDTLFRYDITAVRQLTRPRPTWSDLALASEKYEVECEYIGGIGGGVRDAGSLASSLLKNFGTLLKVLDDTDRLMTTTARSLVLTEYLTLLYPSERGTWTAQVASGQVHGRFLPGPKPVTLERRHLLETGVGPSRKKGHVPRCEDTIVEEGVASFSVVGGTPYTVTEKADGVHRLLFVSSGGAAYTLSVDGTLRVRDSGLSCRPGGRGTSSVIDGEFLRATRTSGSIFAAYDAFVFEGTDLRRLPLMLEEEVAAGRSTSGSRSKPSSRLSACGIVASALAASYAADPERALHVIVKTFFWYKGDMDGMTTGVRRIMARRDAGNFPYHIDGVILTPAAWPMGAATKDGAAKSDATAWHAAMKWKPPDQNSIDFLVRLVPGDGVIRRDGQTYRVAHLYVGYKPSRWDPITTLALLTDGATPAARNAAGAYIPHVFGVPGDVDSDLHVCHLRVSDRDDRLLCVSGEDVVDSTIVEFTFDTAPDGPSILPRSFRWIPLRARPDKTQRYQASGGEIGSAANDIVTAMSVWTSILAPVTEDMMCGLGTGAQADSPDEGPAAYYMSKLRPGAGGMASMRDFHNWVKSSDLMTRFGGDSTRSLFDIGCGRAGDLHTWIKMGLSRILGVDLYRAGIVDPENGANARVMEMRGRTRPGTRGFFPRIVLLPMDASRLIDAAQIESMDQAGGDQTVAKTVWALVDPSSIKDERLRRYHGFGTGGFDMVSCQFAVHYFFGSPATLRAFAANVASHLRPGGYFVGTCMDANRVNGAFDGKRCIQGVKAGKVIWRIQRLYDTFDVTADCRGNTGVRIRVYVQTIGQELEEFLVDYRLLKLAMGEVGLVPPTPEQLAGLGLRDPDTEGGTCLFESSFGRMSRSSSTRHTASASAMSDDEKAFSFLNRWFMFVKSTNKTA